MTYAIIAQNEWNREQPNRDAKERFLYIIEMMQHGMRLVYGSDEWKHGNIRTVGFFRLAETVFGIGLVNGKKFDTCRLNYCRVNVMCAYIKFMLFKVPSLVDW